MRVAAINDISAFGKCSLIADIAVLSAMGVEVCPLPTAVLTAQTGFKSYYALDMTDSVSRFESEWKKMGVSFDGILTGYIMNEKEADHVLDFINTFNRDDNLLLVDPVMGDMGREFSNYSKGIYEKIRKMSLMADIITPNLTELCILAGVDAGSVIKKSGSDSFITEITDIAGELRTDDKQAVVVTGVPLGEVGEIGNMIVSSAGTEIVRSKYNGISYSGTGDLFAASLMGNLLNGKDIVDAVADSAEFINKAVSETKTGDRNYGVDFEKVLSKNRR